MAEREQRFAEVVVPAKPDRVFHYSIPPALAEAVRPGVRVRVSFGRRALDGYVVAVTDRRGRDRQADRRAVLTPIP
jgi:primosomal protein N'